MESAVIYGVVVYGKRVGHTLGFPTANVKPQPLDQRVPRRGVYVGEIRIEDEAAWRRCLINHGFQPTIPSGKETIEVFILDFSGDIYGAKVELAFERYLRAEKKFAGVDALKAQLARDVEAAQERVSSPSS